ncbi:MAG: PTS sugar transporter subunit IIB [bacterium]
MGIVLFRVDDRLIHGQVVEGWFHHLHPDRVVVADDEAAASPFQRSLMALVVPYGIQAEIMTVQEAVDSCREGAYSECRAMIIFRLPRNVLAAINSGLAIDRLNLGGLHGVGKTRSLYKGIIATEEDILDLQAILKHGVTVEIRSVPSEPALDLKSLI